MIQVMVIEDEPPILRSICNKIEEINSNFKVIDTACNGSEAIQKIVENKKIAVIFVDINLPVMNGISVLDYIKRNQFDIFSVVISGYKDFDYVKAAFENNTMDYLLKPLKEEELRRILCRIEEKFLKKNFNHKKKTLENAIHGEVKQVESKELKQYHIILLKAGNFQNGLSIHSTDSSVFEEIELEKIINDYFSKGFSWLINGKSESEKIAFISDEYNLGIHDLNVIFNQIQRSKVPITVVANKIPVSIYQVHTVCCEMKKYMKNSMIFCRSSFLWYSGSQIEVMYTKNNKKINQAILKCKENPQVIVIYQELVSLLQDCMRKPTRQVVVQYMIKRYFSILCNVLPSHKEYIQVEETIEFILMNNYELPTIEKELYFLVETCFGNIKINADDKFELANNIKEYLDLNYHFNISNQLIADKFGFVPSYLSSIFKSYFQVSLNDYIIALRINEAKELLKNSALRVKDIAEEVGYSDPLYFSKAFKKIVGKSPKEYSNSHREQNNQSIE